MRRQRAQAALGAHGAVSWGVQLLTAVATSPTPREAHLDTCESRYWRLCLDGTGLTPAALKGIVAGGGRPVARLTSCSVRHARHCIARRSSAPLTQNGMLCLSASWCKFCNGLQIALQPTQCLF